MSEIVQGIKSMVRKAKPPFQRYINRIASSIGTTVWRRVVKPVYMRVNRTAARNSRSCTRFVNC